MWWYAASFTSLTILYMVYLQVFISSAICAIIVYLITHRIHEVNTRHFLVIYGLSNLALSFIYFKIFFSVTQIIKLNAFTNFVFITTLVTITTIVRLFFHPLSRFPGLKLAAVSKLHEARENAYGRNALTVQALHRQYGDFVRVGPNELSINNVEAVKALFSPQSGCGRGSFYALGQYNPSVLTERDDAVHKKLRRRWFVFFLSFAFAVILTAC